MEKTEAASVEPSTAPQSRPSSKGMPSTKQQNSPVSRAVRTVPRLDSTTDRVATGRAAFQLVPKPP